MRNNLYFKYALAGEDGYYSPSAAGEYKLRFVLNERTEAPNGSYLFLFRQPVASFLYRCCVLLICKAEGIMPRRHMPSRLLPPLARPELITSYWRYYNSTKPPRSSTPKELETPLGLVPTVAWNETEDCLSILAKAVTPIKVIERSPC